MASPEAIETKCIITGLLTSNPLKCTVSQLCKDFREIVGYNVPFQKLGFHNIDDYLRSIPDTVIVHGSGYKAEIEGVSKSNSAHINDMVSKQKNSKIRGPKRKFLKSRHRRINQPSYSNYGNSTYKKVNQSNYGNSTYKTVNQFEPTSPPYAIKSQKVESIQSIKTETIDIISIDSLQERLPKVPQEIQNNLKKLILQFPKGIWCTSLLTEYRKTFNTTFNYNDYSYKSLIELCSDLPEIFLCVRCSSNDYILFDKRNPIPLMDLNEEVAPLTPTENVATNHILNEIPKLNWSNCPVVIPSNVLCLGNQILRYSLDKLQVGDHLDINIGDIYDISKFWIYLDNGELDQLMKDLQIYFSNPKNAILIPELLIEEGLYCICLYGGEFHRAVIVNELPAIFGLVRVNFIDYGTVENVSTNEIWFLPKEFAKVPCQAIRSRLSNICPPYEQSPWSTKAVGRFRELVINNQLICEITRIIQEDNILEMYVADISDEKNIFFINDLLVEEKYARYTDQEKKPTLTDDCPPIVQYLHLYPEFDEIEAGNAPTKAEMDQILANKTPMHHYLPQYFEINYYEDLGAIQDYLNFMKIVKNFTPKPDKIESDFDYSFFPGDLTNKIKEIVEEDETPKLKVDTKIKTNGGEGNSVKTYSCNKKRISEILNGTREKDVKNNLQNTNNGGGSDYDPNFEPKPVKIESDCSFFVGNLGNKMKEHTEKEKPKLKSNQKIETGNGSDSVRTYSCNKKRISDIINSEKDVKSDLDNSYLDEIIPLNNSLNKLNISVPSNKGTNPFLNDDSKVDSNPFRSTNPFLNNLEETLNTSDLFEIFSKSSEGELPGKIFNNLNPSPPPSCSCKTNKEVNLSVSVKNTSNPFKNHIEKNETGEIPRRVRTPPGFNSINRQSTTLLDPNYLNQMCYNNYITNNFSNPNPYYYQRFNQPQFDSLGQQLPPCQPGIMPNYSNFLPQSQFNLQSLQQALAAQSYNQQNMPSLNNQPFRG